MFDLEYYNIVCDCGDFLDEYIENLIKMKSKRIPPKSKRFLKKVDIRYNSVIFDESRKHYENLLGIDYKVWYMTWVNDKIYRKKINSHQYNPNTNLN